MSWFRDGERFCIARGAVAGRPGNVLLLRIDGSALMSIGIGQRELWAVDWQPEGSLLAIGGRGIPIWDAETQQTSMTLSHRSDVFHLSWSSTVDRLVCFYLVH